MMYVATKPIRAFKAAPPVPPAEPASVATDLAAFVAIDWADQKHQVLLQPADSPRKESLVLEQKPEAIADWLAQLKQRFGERKIAVILEQSRGPLISALLPQGNLVLYPINPKTSAKLREAFYPSGSKNDPLDAGLMLDMLLAHRDRLRAWQPDDATTRQLHLLTESRRRFVADQVRLTNRLTSALKSYYPQALELAGQDLSRPMACAFVQQWPTWEAARKAKPQQLRKFYYAHGCRSEEKIQERLQLLAQGQALTTDAAILGAQSLLTRSVARELAVLPGIINEYDRQIEALFKAHVDYALWDSFPGAGPALGPRLAAAWGTQRERFAEAQAMSAFSGIAPVKEQSGQSTFIHMRLGCPKFQRQTFHEFTACSLRGCLWARCCYELLLERGKGHHAAVRAVGLKWQRIMFRCWQTRTPYDEAKYVESLRHNSPVLYARILAAQQAARTS